MYLNLAVEDLEVLCVQCALSHAEANKDRLNDSPIHATSLEIELRKPNAAGIYGEKQMRRGMRRIKTISVAGNIVLPNKMVWLSAEQADNISLPR
jgi:hypothetical protein